MMGSFTTQVRIADVRISLVDQGTGPALLLLHGFPATRYLWSKVVPPLVRAGFRVIVPDLVGYGASEAPPDVRIDMGSQARWMQAVMNELGVRRFALVAHDVGTAAAQLMVVSCPERLRGVALLDGVYGGDWAMEAISSIQSWDPTQAHRLFAVLKRRLGKTAELREMLSAYEGQEGGLRLIRASKDLDPHQTEEIGDGVRASGVPTLVLWGERDEFLPLERVGQRLADSLQTALVRLPGEHFTPLDCPSQVADALCAFLGGLPPDSDHRVRASA
jgi:pimeloyl-ACP methyl ester carboxylesterase